MPHISSGVLLTFPFCRGHSDQRQPVASQRSHSYKEAELRWKPSCSDPPTSKPLPSIPPLASAVVGIGRTSSGLGSACEALWRLQQEWGGMQAGLPARLLSQGLLLRAGKWPSTLGTSDALGPPHPPPPFTEGKANAQKE